MKMNLKFKIAVLLASVSIILIVGSISISYGMFTRSLLDKYNSNVDEISASGELLLRQYDIEGMMGRTLEIYKEAYEDNGGVPDLDIMSDEERAEYYARFDEITQSDEYKRLLKSLQDMTRVNDALAVYTAVFDVENQKAIYFADGADAVRTEVIPCGYIDDIDAGLLSEFINKTYTFVPYETINSKDGWLYTSSKSMFTDSGELIGNIQTDVSLEQIRKDRIKVLIRLIWVMTAFSLFLILIANRITNRNMVEPLNKLAKAAKGFVSDREGNGVIALEKLDIKTGDEIQTLSESFSQMGTELTGYIDELMHITAEKSRLGVELELATKIQANILPSTFPPFPDRKDFDIYASMTPAKEVGGDFYDFFLIDDTHLGLVMADVSGKGVPAALFMMVSKTLIKSYVRSGASVIPSEILSYVNNQLCENNKAEMFVTVWLGILDLTTGELISASAGHEYPAVRRKGGEFELIKDKHGLPLAGMPGIRYSDYKTVLEPGDIVFVYTDGVTEATNAEYELFGTDKMLQALNFYKGGECKEILDKVRTHIDEFVKNAPQFDDITMMAVRYDGQKA